MPLDIGTVLGHYEIVGSLGAGGMGEVYRARDPSLEREVAIKVLPEAFAESEERLARFEREAKALAALNHPNIATVYGFEADGDTRFLVMELVEGEDLAERIARGPIPVDEAIPLFIQIAEGLEAAHERGIVHRDLKPANIKVGSDGRVKILDFGLAKAMESASHAVHADLSQSPTMTAAATRRGEIMGTAAYMSPEQATGKATDKRTDIWSFGVCLYEALTGKRPFAGDDATSVLAAVLRDEVDLEDLPADGPATVRRLLARCLQKDPRDRLRDIGDARLELMEPISDLGETHPEVPRWRWQELAPWVAGALVLGVLLGLGPWLTSRRDAVAVSAAEEVHHYTVDAGVRAPGWRNRAHATISSDGQTLVFLRDQDGEDQIWVRSAGDPSPRPLEGTEGASWPFLSPDGEWIAFEQGGELRRVRVGGGSPTRVTGIGSGLRGGAWGPDDLIVMTPHASTGLWQVSASGGEATVLTTVAREQGEFHHLSPTFLPNGWILFTVALSDHHDGARIEALSIESGERKVLFEGGYSPLYAASGHLLVVREGSVLAAPFDLERMEVTGPAEPVLEINSHVGFGYADYSISSQGTLTYTPPTRRDPSSRQPVWLDADGGRAPLGVDPGPYRRPRISPDGRWLALETEEPSGSVLWTIELPGGTPRRFTFEGSCMWPLWYPDSERIAFASLRDGAWGVYSKSITGGDAQLVRSFDGLLFPDDWTPDGRDIIAVTDNTAGGTGIDIVLLPSDESQPPRTLVSKGAEDYGSDLSPNGEWLAFTSDDDGEYRVFVERWGGDRQQHQITDRVSMEPVWSADGQDLYFVDSTGVLMTTFSFGSTLTWADTRRLHSGVFYNGSGRDYDVGPDGRIIVLEEAADTNESAQIHVVVNWLEELKRLVPVD